MIRCKISEAKWFYASYDAWFDDSGDAIWEPKSRPVLAICSKRLFSLFIHLLFFISKIILLVNGLKLSYESSSFRPISFIRIVQYYADANGRMPTQWRLHRCGARRISDDLDDWWLDTKLNEYARLFLVYACSGGLSIDLRQPHIGTAGQTDFINVRSMMKSYRPHDDES